MEKYVLQALFEMGYDNFALTRMKERFGTMVNHPTITTLWEGWGIGAEGYGGGTTNHAWSGGGLTLLSQYVAGVHPTAAGYKTFRVRPQLGFLKYVQAVVPSIKGDIKVSINKNKGFELSVEVPEGCTALIHIPREYSSIEQNGKQVSFKTNKQYHEIKITTGNYTFKAK